MTIDNDADQDPSRGSIASGRAPSRTAEACPSQFRSKGGSRGTTGKVVHPDHEDFVVETAKLASKVTCEECGKFRQGSRG